MKKRLLLSCFLLIISYSLFAQSVGIGTTTPHSSAALEIRNNTKGLLMPTMTAAQRNTIISPAKGLMVYDTTNNAHYFYNGNTWKPIGSSQFKTDSSLNIGNQIRPVSNFILGTNANSSDTAGYLYDNGGPAGNYGNNRNDVFTILQGGALGIILELQEMDTEDPYDSLRITVGSFTRTYWGTQTDTLIFDDLTANVAINFKSNTVNTQAGFKLYWKKILIGSNPVTGYDSTQKSGWYYNEVKQYMRGGINRFNNWHPDSSGIYSFSFGDNTKAKGSGSFSAGINTSALGASSTAFGNSSIASGYASTAMGNLTTASGANSIAMGYATKASGSSSTAMGNGTTASGNSSTALGNYSTASGNSSTALGNYSTASGNSSTAMGSSRTYGDYSGAIGLGLKSRFYGGMVVGLYNDSTVTGYGYQESSSNRIFQIGNGGYVSGGANAIYAYKNAMTVLQNGNVGIGELVPTSLLHVSGAGTKVQLTLEDTTNNKIIKLSNDGGSNGPYIGTSTNHPFSIVTNNAVRAVFSNTGNVGIGDANPDVNLVVKEDIRIDAENSNNGDRTNSLRFGSSNTGEFIASKRTATGNQYGLDFYTAGNNRLAITNGGTIQVTNNLTVQNGKGILRNTDGTQSKKLSTTVAINTTFTSGQTLSFPITWPETFSSTPEAFVGNVTGGTGGWAEVVMTISGAGTSGATLYVYNPKSGSVTPNFTVKIIAIGPQ